MEPTMAAAASGTSSLSGNRRSMSWGSSISHSFRQPDTDDPFRRARSCSDNDEENLRWAALEKLPTYGRMRHAIVLNQDGAALARIEQLARGEAGRALLERVFQDDSERFLRRLRDRADRVGIDLPAIEVRYQDISVEVDAFVSSRALPTLWNATTNFLQMPRRRFESDFPILPRLGDGGSNNRNPAATPFAPASSCSSMVDWDGAAATVPRPL